MKNISKKASHKIYISTFTIVSLLFCVYLVLLLFTRHSNSIILNVSSDLLNTFSEDIYNLTTCFELTSIAVIVGFLFIMILAMRNNKALYRKIFLTCLIIIAIFLTYLRGREIVELKVIGYELVNEIEKYYLIKNELPMTLGELYECEASQETIELIKDNFVYMISDPNDPTTKSFYLLLKPIVTRPTIYLYDNSKGQFVIQGKF